MSRIFLSHSEEGYNDRRFHRQHPAKHTNNHDMQLELMRTKLLFFFTRTGPGVYRRDSLDSFGIRGERAR